MSLLLRGTVHLFGNDVNTDDIIPARYLNTTDPKVLAAHLMEDVRPGFSGQLKAGDIIVAGENFGCGSSREHAPIALRAAGVSCVIAESFARIFFRNAINIGVPIVECPGILKLAREGETVAVDLAAGSLTLHAGKVIPITPFPPFMERIVREGGWMPYLKAAYGKGEPGR
jgi:3-isopropylmalate/(R)-2-methylmalate dehydratase small subunit